MCRASSAAKERRARLDLWYADPHRGHTWVDITICAATVHDGVSVKQRFARRERKKHERYVGGELIPFAIDPRGSWGPEAKAWVQHILGQLRKKLVYLMIHCFSGN